MGLCYQNIHNKILIKSNEFPIIKKEIERNGIIKIKDQDLDFFTFVTKTIISQQISDIVASSIWNSLCDQFKSESMSIANFKNLTFLKKMLKGLKISKQKKNYICSLYSAVLKNEIDGEKLKEMNENEVSSRMLKYKGIGLWTCNMALIFYFKKLNIFPNNDLIIKKMAVKLNLLEKKKINFKSQFSPFLSIFSLHLWKMSKRVL